MARAVRRAAGIGRSAPRERAAPVAAKPKIIVDFNTKFIGPEKRVWSLFPGKEYKFYAHFMDQGVVFGDFPGLLLRDVNIDDDDTLRKWIALSDKVRTYYTDRKSDDKNPSRDPENYKGYKWTGPRLNAKGVIMGLYSRAKKGDLVLVPAKGGAWASTRIGEFTDDPKEIVYEQNVRRYQKEKVPARRVRWIGAIDNRGLPEEFYHQLTSPNAFRQVGRSYYDFVYRRAYGNFMRTEMANSMFDIGAEEFSTVPDMYLKIIANFAAEVAKNIEDETIDEFLDRPFADWLFDIEESDFFANQKISVNSPGKNLLHSITITPILAVVIFALCQYPATEIKASDLEFTNSAAGGQLDPCDIPVVENAKIAFDMMSLEKLELLCKAATKAQKMGRIKTPIKTRVHKDAG
ncbi:hypothetical protein [Mesorhizobium sp.]|uniref:hypothetical protein n=1 Tax=Mesorhizobium sp. TaxID=1871066 RepID=UPI000FEA7560|nr:hypothetical protein [Mesorhizobium sp.]RWB73582.1 MAG: hypothetical protein EOQ49_08560 [Mesorhizobium sp.]